MAIETERERLLSDSANAMEYYLDNLEGSAMYVEGQVYRKLRAIAIAGAECLTSVSGNQYDVRVSVLLQLHGIISAGSFY